MLAVDLLREDPNNPRTGDSNATIAKRMGIDQTTIARLRPAIRVRPALSHGAWTEWHRCGERPLGNPAVDH